jgi:ABC-type multidrug transport system fused ATPase/permease subunit
MSGAAEPWLRRASSRLASCGTLEIAVTLARVPSRRQTDSAVGWTLSFLRPYRRAVAALALLSAAEIALRALAPWPIKAIVDALSGSHASLPGPLRSWTPTAPAALLAAVVGAGLLLQLGHELVLMVHTRVQSRIAQQMVFDLRSVLFTHFQYLSLAHHSTGTTADSVYRLEADAGCLESLLLRGVFPLAFSVMTLLVMFIILLRLDPLLASIALIVIPFLYLSLCLSMTGMRPKAERAKALESAVVTRLYESLSAIRLVKVFAREEHELRRFSAAATAAMRERMDVTRQETTFSFLVGAITSCGASLVLAIGGLHVLEGKLTVGTLLAILAYLGFVYGPLSAIATTTGSLHNAVASARRVREVLRLPRERDRHAADAAPVRLQGAVRFDNVSFSYGLDGPVLCRVSFTAQPGETVALVGLSGAGKTTIVSLLGRLYEPSDGTIFIDGIDVRHLPLRSLREQIAVVPQESILLSGTVGENIRYGRLDAADDEVRLAAAAAGCDEFIAHLPRGIETEVGENGAKLSGGQRQRVSIARAFLKDAPILILDEPTASLDSIAEQAVLASLTRLRNGRTTFVIAHRLSTVRDADRILVLDGGAVVASGRHEDLLTSSVLYRHLTVQLSQAEAPLALGAPA